LLSGLIVPSAEQSAEKLEELDSSRAKARSEEKNKELMTAHLKVPPFKATQNEQSDSKRVFQQTVKPTRNRT